MEKAPSSLFLVTAAAAAVPDLSLALASAPAGSSLDGDGEAARTARVDGKKVRLLECLFCDKTFVKSQALGGHQNAHRKDRLFSDPYDYGASGVATMYTAASSSGLPCDSAAGRSVCTGRAPTPPPTADTWRLSSWSGVAPRFAERAPLVDPFASGRDGVEGQLGSASVAIDTGEALDLELRL